MSNIWSLSMANTHNNVEFGVLQKTSKQSLISIFFYIRRGDTPLPYPPPARNFVPRSRASPLLRQIRPPPPTRSFLDPPLIVYRFLLSLSTIWRNHLPYLISKWRGTFQFFIFFFNVENSIKREMKLEKMQDYPTKRCFSKKKVVNVGNSIKREENMKYWRNND